MRVNTVHNIYTHNTRICYAGFTEAKAQTFPDAQCVAMEDVEEGYPADAVGDDRQPLVGREADSGAPPMLVVDPASVEGNEQSP